MKICLYCLELLDLVARSAEIRECANCGLLYSRELCDNTTDAWWEHVLSDDRYRIVRTPGNPPEVVVFDDGLTEAT